MKRYFVFLLSLLCFFATVILFLPQPTPFELVPSVFKGRIRPLDTTARLWLDEFYHHQQILRSHEKQVGEKSAIQLMWQMQLLGHEPWDRAPLFWLDGKAFDYITLKSEKDLSVQLTAVMQQFSQIKGLASLLVEEKTLNEWVLAAELNGIPPKDIALKLETQVPFSMRLENAGILIRTLPGRYKSEWYPLTALLLKVYNPFTKQFEYAKNFTIYSDQTFEAIRQLYLRAIQQKDAASLNLLAEKLIAAYHTLEGQPFQQAAGKAIDYPLFSQLYLEVLYYQFPLLELTMVLYFLAILVFLFSYTLKKELWRPYAFALCFLAFTLHSLILIMRCYILNRAPVSNMYETIIYVPWLAMLLGIILQYLWKDYIVPFCACIGALGLLLVLQFTQANSSLENVQAVLDSQYWLIIHVLMIVGSYGVFALCGILGHLYLLKPSEKVGPFILQTMYIGCAMIIPGTILGGVWAAESWGRFWDWDPKESWAFISSCTYLIAIHAYTFRRIGFLGLSILSLIGLQAIGFTWYGVNYILGTGLHSYGFGSGGEIYYYGFILAEIIFVVTILTYRVCRKQNTKNVHSDI